MAGAVAEADPPPGLYSLTSRAEYEERSDLDRRHRRLMSGLPLGRRAVGMAGLSVLSVVLIVAFLSTPTPGIPGPSASATVPTPQVLPTPRPTERALAPLDDPVVVVDGRYDANAPRTVRSPSRHKNQSKLFFVDGSWWGILQEPVSREAHIQRLDWATQRWHDTGVVVDDRPFARADALVHDDTLYVASAGGSDSPEHAVRVSSFHYDRAAKRWSLSPDFPVTVTDSGVESSLIERASNGRLWVAFVQAGRLLVSHSTDDDHRWVEPFRPVVTGSDVATDQVGMAAVGNEVILLWSNQKDQAVYATSHDVGRPDAEWAPPTTVLRGLRLADNHVNMKALPDGRLFAAVKTSLDTVPNNQPGWDQILLLVRDHDGGWSSHQVSQIRDKQTRPIVVLDTSHGEILVFATAPTSGGAIYMKHTPMGKHAFTTGRGSEVIATTSSARINDSTSTKQAVDASTGLVVLATDKSTGRYVHLAASLGGPAPGRPAQGAPPDGPEPAPSEPVTLVDEPMDVQQLGATLDPLWRSSPSRSGGTARYVRREGSDLAARLLTTGTGELRPCRSLGATNAGHLLMGLDVRIDKQGATDSIMLMARGDGSELAAIRVDEQLRVRISEADARPTTNARLVPGRWYRAELDLDVAARTFTARLLDAQGKVILRRSDRPWRTPSASAVDGLCLAASTGRGGLGLSFDDVTVVRSP